MKSIIILFSIVASVVIFSTNASLLAYGESYLEQVKANYDNYNNSLWSLGNNIQKGDYFVYKICNDDTIYQVIYPYHCYTINLEFVTILQSYTGDVWIVQGNFTTPDITEQMIFLIDVNTFDVSTDPFNKKIGDSLEKTIFSLSIYGEKSLSIGTVWDEIDSYYTNKIPLEIKNKQSIEIFTPSSTPNSSNYSNNYSGNYTSVETSVLSYDIIIPSNVYLHSNFPFPLKAKLYSSNIIYPEPQELYYFELLEYQSGYQSGDKSRKYSETSEITIERLGGLEEE